MTLMDIIIKIALFFAVFYGAIAITALLTKRLNKEKKPKSEEEE